MRWRSPVSICWRLSSEPSVMIRLGIPLHRFNHERSRILRGETRRNFRKTLELLRIVNQLADFLRQQLGGEVGFFQEQGRAGANENLGVPRLVILGRVRIWN